MKVNFILEALSKSKYLVSDYFLERLQVYKDSLNSEESSKDAFNNLVISIKNVFEAELAFAAVPSAIDDIKLSPEEIIIGQIALSFW